MVDVYRLVLAFFSFPFRVICATSRYLWPSRFVRVCIPWYIQFCYSLLVVPFSFVFAPKCLKCLPPYLCCFLLVRYATWLFLCSHRHFDKFDALRLDDALFRSLYAFDCCQQSDMRHIMCDLGLNCPRCGFTSRGSRESYALRFALPRLRWRSTRV